MPRNSNIIVYVLDTNDNSSQFAKKNGNRIELGVIPVTDNHISEQKPSNAVIPCRYSVISERDSPIADSTLVNFTPMCARVP